MTHLAVSASLLNSLSALLPLGEIYAPTSHIATAGRFIVSLTHPKKLFTHCPSLSLEIPLETTSETVLTALTGDNTGFKYDPTLAIFLHKFVRLKAIFYNTQFKTFCFLASWFCLALCFLIIALFSENKLEYSFHWSVN